MFEIYDQFPYDGSSNGFRNELDGWRPKGTPSALHNAIHVWVFGHTILNTSPNDPVFFLNHCNMDRIWTKWQTKPKISMNLGYPPDGDIKYPNGERIKQHNRLDIMIPWNGEQFGNATVEGTLDHKTMDYKYI
jgi:tyrosinase